MVEGEDAVHLGAGDIQSLGGQQLGGFIDITKFLLQSVDSNRPDVDCLVAMMTESAWVSRKKVAALSIHHTSHMLSEAFGKFQYDKNRIWPRRHPHLILI